MIYQWHCFYRPSSSMVEYLPVYSVNYSKGIICFDFCPAAAQVNKEDWISINILCKSGWKLFGTGSPAISQHGRETEEGLRIFVVSIQYSSKPETNILTFKILHQKYSVGNFSIQVSNYSKNAQLYTNLVEIEKHWATTADTIRLEILRWFHQSCANLCAHEIQYFLKYKLVKCVEKKEKSDSGPVEIVFLFSANRHAFYREDQRSCPLRNTMQSTGLVQNGIPAFPLRSYLQSSLAPFHTAWNKANLYLFRRVAKVKEALYSETGCMHLIFDVWGHFDQGGSHHPEIDI